MNGPVLRTRALSLSIGGKRVCRQLELSVGAGECWALLGENGSGKTTLLHVLAGLREPDSGALELLGRPATEWDRRELAKRRGLLTQDSVDAFPMTVLEAALVGRYPHHHGIGWERSGDYAIARAALEELGLDAAAGRDCTTLSGGERRRLAAATVLAQQPELFLLDEPTNHLDPHHQVRLLEVIRGRCRRGAAALMSLHDPNLASRFCTHALLLFGEGEVASGPADSVLSGPALSRLYRHPMRAHATPDGTCFIAAVD